MNILFVGQYDIVGSHAARKFYKEGHNVFWLTETETDVLWDKNVKGKVYRGALQKKLFDNVCLSNEIDTVIYLTSGLRENADTCYNINYESILQNLKCLLGFCIGKKLKHFIFLSSIEVNGDETPSTLENREPRRETPLLSELVACENICLSCSGVLPVLVLRTAYIYDSMKGSDFLRRIIDMSSQDEIRVFCAQDSKFDFLHCSDAAEALFKVCMERHTGIYNLSTGIGTELTEVISLLNIENVHYPNRNTIIHVASPDKLMRDSGWSVHHSFIDDFDPGCFFADNNNSDLRKHPKKTAKEGLRARIKKRYGALLPFVENLALFVILFGFVNFIWRGSELNAVDFGLFYIILVVLICGGKQGYIAIVLASISYIYSISKSGLDIIYMMFDTRTWIPMIMFLFVGIILMFLLEKNEDKVHNIKISLDKQKEEYAAIRSFYDDVIRKNSDLQKQILMSDNSFGKTYEIVRALDQKNRYLFWFSFIGAVQSIFGEKSIGIYLADSGKDNQFSLFLCSAKGANIPNTISAYEFTDVISTVQKQKIYVNRNLEPELPSMAAGFEISGRLTAVVMIYRLSVEQRGIFYQNLLMVTCGIGEIIQGKNETISGMSENHVDQTYIFNETEFKDQLSALKSVKEKMDWPYQVARISEYVKSATIQEFANKLSPVLRNTDTIGVCGGNYYIAMIGTTDREAVENRFGISGIKLYWENIP